MVDWIEELEEVEERVGWVKDLEEEEEEAMPGWVSNLEEEVMVHCEVGGGKGKMDRRFEDE